MESSVHREMRARHVALPLIQPADAPTTVIACACGWQSPPLPDDDAVEAWRAHRESAVSAG